MSDLADRLESLIWLLENKHIGTATVREAVTALREQQWRPSEEYLPAIPAGEEKKFWVAYKDEEEDSGWFMHTAIYDGVLGWLSKTPDYYCDCLPPSPAEEKTNERNSGT